MADGITFQFTFNRFPEIVAGMDEALNNGIDVWCRDTVGLAQAAAPEITGKLKSSGFWITSLENNFSGDAAPARPAVGGVIGFSAPYAQFVNEGHHTRSGSFVPANPFFTSTVEGESGNLHEAVADALNELIEG